MGRVVAVSRIIEVYLQGRVTIVTKANRDAFADVQ